MRVPRIHSAGPPPALPPLPGWIGATTAPGLEAAAFRSGAALAHLALATSAADLPQALWRDRLALSAAEVAAVLSGRPEPVAGLRDALHLTRPGDDPGPAGRLLRQWSRSVRGPITVAALAAALEGVEAGLVAQGLDAAGATPVDRAARAMETVLADRPRAITAALILADAALSQALDRDRLVPLLSLALRGRDLGLRGDALRLACHRAAVVGAQQAAAQAAELARAAARLRAVAPKLRARGASRAVELFLSRDALAASALDVMTDRAARRLCDRLLALGALRELTGRDTFRLYGL